MSAAWLPSRKEFHMYYGVKDGRVGHAVSTDLVDWEKEEPVMQPGDGCRFDGGSVIEHEGELVMYHSHRCCADYDCPTAIRRATSTDGFAWTAREEPVLEFDTDPFLTWPYVVYEAARARFLMVLATGKSLPIHYYRSVDGIEWTKAGETDFPSGHDPSGLYFHLMDIGESRWLRRFGRNFQIGTVDADGVFQSDSGGVLQPVAFPVSNHPDLKNVEIGRETGGAVFSLPWSLTMRNSTYPGLESEYPDCEWIPSVEELIEKDPSGTPNTGYPTLKAPVTLIPSSVSVDGLYHFSASVEGLKTANFFMLEAFTAGEEVVAAVTVYWNASSLFEIVDTQNGAMGWISVSNRRRNEAAEFLDIFIDDEVLEVRIDGTARMYPLTPGVVTASARITGGAETVAVLDGWTLDPVRRLSPSDAPTLEAPTTSGASAVKAAAAGAAAAFFVLL
eukprot:Polyplicarium_translucidae@DN1940_c0_g1_i1.p1